MKRFLTLAILFLLLIGTMPVAYAQESIPEVSTLSELQDAIAQAEEGDTIKITQTITINVPVTLGIDGKPVTLCGSDGLETLLRFEGDWGYASYCWLCDLTIDGTGSFDGSKVVVSTPNAVYTTRVNWQNCSTNGSGAAMRIDRGTVYTMEGSFSNCSADLGGAIYADTNTSLYPSGCTFSNCYSRRDGGAVYTMGTTTIDNCTFINNSAVNGNGGAAAGINLSVRNSTITGNRALYGGGLYLLGGTVQNSKVYSNIGDFAALIYGLLSTESKAECDKIAENCFNDLYGSPYEEAVAALTSAGAFWGGCGETFDPEGVLSYGQFLTVLTRFIEPEKGYVGSFNVLDHWAAPAAIKAASAGWIDDVPIDLNAHATYGAFVNLLVKIYNL